MSLRTPRRTGKPDDVSHHPPADRPPPVRSANPRRPAAGRSVPALDGVRALAILAVLADHGGVDGLRGGFIGVDIFFVLSGFLITSLLLAELARTGRIDLAGFWTRRARRLLPALVVLVVAVGLGRRLFPDDAVAGLRGDALAALGWVANWRFEAADTDYFAQGGTASPLQHTWSLGVEEQYYLIWPLLLVAVAAGLALLARGSRSPATAGSAAAGDSVRRRAVGALAGLGAALSAAEAVVLSADGPLGRVYFGTDTRAQALLLGGLAAAVLAPLWGRRARRAGPTDQPLAQPPGATAGRLLMLGGLTALTVALTRATGTVGEFHGGVLTGVAVAAAAVVAGVLLDPRGPLTRALSARPLVLLGRVSYGVYLWHWPIFLVLDGERTGMTGLPLFTVRCAATLVAAGASWVLVEQPVQRWRPVPRRVLPVVACAVIVAGGLVITTVPAGAPALAATSLPPDAAGPGAMQDTAPEPAAPDRTASATGAAVGSRSLGRTGQSTPAEPTAAAASSRVRTSPGAAGRQESTKHDRVSTAGTRREENRPLRVSVFGDSIAWTLMRYLPATAGMTFLDHTALGCGIAQGGPYRYFGDLTEQRAECDAWPTTWAVQVTADQPDLVLLLVGRWETMDRTHDGQWMHLGDPAYDAYLSGRINKAMQVLRSTGAAVVVATEPYNRRGEKPDGSLFPEDDPARVDRWNTLLRGAASASEVAVLDLHAKLSPDGRYTQSVDGLRVRSDGVHLTPDGVAWLTPWLVDSLRSASNRR